MEGKSMHTVAVVVVLMLLYAGSASASFRKCRESCIEYCMRDNFSGHTTTWCSTKCFFKCLGRHHRLTDSSCNADCIANFCAQFGDDIDKVEQCVDTCGTNQCARV